ncbi:MAG TPA: DUF2851 family protein [Chthoniobacterales bacterium]
MPGPADPVVLYHDFVQPPADLVSEDELARRWSELEWQTWWYAGAFGTAFRATNGAVVEVLSPGLWNHEAGPDFTNVVIRVDGKEETLRGDMEFDRSALDWERHGHGVNERFNHVVLHVFVRPPGCVFFTRTADHREVLQVHLQAPAPEHPAILPGGHRAKPGACRAPLAQMTQTQIEGVLEIAARVRLERKGRLLQRSIKVHGFAEALFQQVAMALGYKENKLPFLLLAQRASLRLLRQQPAAAEAILFGLSGFLEQAAQPGGAAPTASAHLKKLWSAWWGLRGELCHFVLSPEQWRLTSTRPSNHPQRRLGALSVLASRWPELQGLPSDLPAVRRFFHRLSHPFWDHHYTLQSAPSARSIHLIGSARIADLLANVFVPLMWISGQVDWAVVKRLPAELDNGRLELTRQRLFGERAEPNFAARYLYQQQGLLQVAEDFCNANGHDCSLCRFPAYLSALDPSYPAAEAE